MSTVWNKYVYEYGTEWIWYRVNTWIRYNFISDRKWGFVFCWTRRNWQDDAVNFASFNRKHSLIVGPVWCQIGFWCLHDTIFIPYRIRKRIHFIPYSSSSSWKQKANTIWKHIVYRVNGVFTVKGLSFHFRFFILSSSCIFQFVCISVKKLTIITFKYYLDNAGRL